MLDKITNVDKVTNYIRNNVITILFSVVFILIYVFPTYQAGQIFGMDIGKYIFLFITIIMYFFLDKHDFKLEMCMFFLIILICAFQRSLYPLNLISLLLLPSIINQIDDKNKDINKKLLIMCGTFIIIYSLIYFGYMGRYVYTGIREINQSGFAIMMFAIVVRKKSKILSNIIFALGIFTFSRNYILCSTVFLICDIFHIRIPKIKFQYLAIISIVVLVGLSALFQYKYDRGEISKYKTGLSSTINLFDYSNFFRFTVNTNLVEIYYNNPVKLLTGLSDEEFYNLQHDLSMSKDIVYRKVNCHNYFFSYLKIYGIFAIGIIAFVSIIINKVLSKNNMHIFLSIFLYATFLGIGLASYWIYLSIFILLLYREKEEVRVDE